MPGTGARPPIWGGWIHQRGPLRPRLNGSVTGLLPKRIVQYHTAKGFGLLGIGVWGGSRKARRMYKVDLYVKVRRAVKVENQRERTTAKRFGVSRKTVSKML